MWSICIILQFIKFISAYNEATNHESHDHGSWNLSLRREKYHRHHKRNPYGYWFVKFFFKLYKIEKVFLFKLFYNYLNFFIIVNIMLLFKLFHNYLNFFIINFFII